MPVAQEIKTQAVERRDKLSFNSRLEEGRLKRCSVTGPDKQRDKQRQGEYMQ